MKKKRFSEAQIVKVLKEAEAGVPVTDLCRQHGISTINGKQNMPVWISPLY